MSQQVVLIAGSPQAESRSSRVLASLEERLSGAGIRTKTYALSDFVAADLVFARADAPAVQQYVADVQSAAAVLFATPVYKATYAGGLKLLLDLIPPEALRGRTVLAVATARVGRHFAGVQRAFEELYRFFDVGLAIPSVLLLDEQARLEARGIIYDSNAEQALDKAAVALLHALAVPQTVGNGGVGSAAVGNGTVAEARG
jgi:FMN reductase